MCEEVDATAFDISSGIGTDCVEACEATSVSIQLLHSDKILLRNTCQTHPLFCQITPDEFTQSLTCWEIDEGRWIFEEGKKAMHFYVLREGKIRLVSLNHIYEIATPGACFGDRGLATSSRRLESTQTLTNVCFWRMSASRYRAFVQAIQSQQFAVTAEALTRSSLFTELPAEMASKLPRLLTPLKYALGAKIVSQGEPGDCMFLMVSGEVVVTENETQKRRLGPGEWFGEQAILYHLPRTASVTASTPEVSCLSISAKAFAGPLGKSVQQLIYKNTQRIALDRSPHFANFSEEAKDRLIDSMLVETFEQDEVVVKASTWRGFALWIVVCGAVKSAGCSFGVYACIDDEMVLGTPEGCFDHDIIADCFEVAVASIGRTELEECLGVPSSLPSGRIPISAIPQIRLFDDLPRGSISRLCLDVLLVAYSPGEVVLGEEKASEWIFVIKSGAVKEFKAGRLLRIPTVFDFFGELNILPDSEKWLTVISEGHTECWKIAKGQFLDDQLPTSLQTRYRQWDRMWQVTGLQDLTPVALLTGSEDAATITLVTSTQGHLYAAKVVLKSEAIESRRQLELLAERDVLLRLNHPFIPHMLRTFKNRSSVFFLSEFVNGSSLFAVIHERRVLSLSDARFYSGAVLLVLEYLHRRKILYRDLKPENVLLDRDGYIQLIDFSCAKVADRTKSLIGTPHFTAPEVIMGKAYDASVDLWSLGVLLFEMLAGGVPFAQLEEDPFTVYSLILTDQFVIPPFVAEHRNAANLIAKLLSRSPQDRGSAASLRNESFFSDFPFVGAT